MPDKIRWGILSTARIGKDRVIPAMHLCKNGVVAAVASRDLTKAQAFAHETSIPVAYGSYEELLADPNIDAIYNPLPNSLHAEWCYKSAEAGKPMLCEKPLAKDAAEAQSMVDAFAKRGVLFAEAFMYRFHPQTQRVKQMVDSGAVGEVRAIASVFNFNISSEDDIRLSKPLAGGALMDIGCYCVNVIRLMTGQEPEEVKAVGIWGKRSNVDETLAGVMRFASGAVGHFDCSFRAPFTHLYDIRGTEGRILVGEAFVVSPDRESVIRYWHGDQYEEIKIAPVNQYTLMAEDFADALLNKRAPRFPPEDAVANMRVIDRLYQSAGS